MSVKNHKKPENKRKKKKEMLEHTRADLAGFRFQAYFLLKHIIFTPKYHSPKLASKHSKENIAHEN